MVPLYKPYLSQDALQHVQEVLQNGWLGYGKKAMQLEAVFTEQYQGFALATNSGTSALNLAARTIKQTPQDEVIIPAITFVSTGIAFYDAGYTVVVADVMPDTGLIDVESVRKNITPNTRAIVGVHLYGQLCELQALRDLCDEKGIYLIEDCAHRVGLADAQRLGDFACYSFNVMKEIPSGEGGLLWGKDQNLAAKARQHAYVGMNVNTLTHTNNCKHLDYEFSAVSGLKLMQNDVLAALTLSLLPHLAANITKRQQIAARYDAMLSGQKNAAIIPRTEGDSYLMYIAQLKQEDVNAFREHLASHGVSTSHHYVSLAEHPLFVERYPCTQAKAMQDKLVTLPCFVDMTQSELNEVLSAIQSYQTL